MSERTLEKLRRSRVSAAVTLVIYQSSISLGGLSLRCCCETSSEKQHGGRSRQLDSTRLKSGGLTALRTDYNCGMMATNRRILRSLGNGPTRRNLFGPVDRELLQVEYQAALQRDLEEATQRWGYDFISDKPLENSGFQWEGIPGTKVPLLYRPCMLGVGQRPAAAKVSPKGGRVEKENSPGTPERCLLNLKILEKTPEKEENGAVKRKQTNITDFYQAKRRVVGMPRKSGE